MTAFPQYAKTTSAAVLEVIRQNKELDKAFFDKGQAFAEANGGTGFYSSRWGSTVSVAAIAVKELPTTGRWREHPRGKGFIPYKNNPLYNEFEAIELRMNAIPGLPEYVESEYDEHMRHYIASPKPFVLDGAVFVGFNFVPQDRNSKSDPNPADGGWEEIKASEWHAARESYNERVTSHTEGVER
ncbi:hypothetical protein [Microbacterium sp. 4NA327F11]|uniref:hypothetical protein n=1 Tax=Microbacterium sp. 4NA327F11 TaxID=2502229 RepID=UPI0010F476A6|nr:hypothetical protein [Microbacterium sp. 4NA327F11]